MSRLSHELLSDIDKNTVDFNPNYDGSEREPTVLPTRLPNLLINGASGIAVGMATNIPPHNLNEVIDGVITPWGGELERYTLSIPLGISCLLIFFNSLLELMKTCLLYTSDAADE